MVLLQKEVGEAVSPQLVHLRRYSGWVLFLLTLCLTSISLVLLFHGETHFDGVGPPNTSRLVNDLGYLLWSFVGALLIFRKPQNIIGWLFSLIALLNTLDQFAWGYAYYGYVANPGALPGVVFMIIWLNWTGVILALYPASLLFLLFPTGRPLSPRWGKLIWIGGIAVCAYILFSSFQRLPFFREFPFPSNILASFVGLPQSATAPLLPLTLAAYAIIVLCLFAAIGSLIIRLRKASGVERQQIKWFVFATGLAIPGVLTLIIGAIIDNDTVFDIGLLILRGFIVAIAAATAIAILRYHLFDIDIIIRRTLTYSILTALLLIVYFVIIISLQSLINALGRQGNSTFITVLTTLIIAAIFNPLRRKIQDIIDHRFYRKKYDAAQALNRFAVTARDEVDLDELSTAILEVINNTIQPDSISLWLDKRPTQNPNHKENDMEKRYDGE